MGPLDCVLAYPVARVLPLRQSMSMYHWTEYPLGHSISITRGKEYENIPRDKACTVARVP
jgi:hypothetical protein